MKEADLLKERAAAILQSAAEKKAERAGQLAETEEAAAALRAELTDDSLTLAAFKKKNAELRDLEDRAAWLSSFTGGPLVPVEEYQEAAAAVKKAFAARCDETRAALVDLVDRAAALGADLCADMNAANDALHTWQKDVYKNADRKSTKNRSGETVYYDNRDELTVAGGVELLAWVAELQNSPCFKSAVGFTGTNDAEFKRFLFSRRC